MTPLVTVIIATYNCSSTLRLALQSLLGQSFQAFEAWIVGDHCTDDSQQVVKSFQDPRLQWINLPHNSGSQAQPNNEGLRSAKGRYIAYLGQDDLWFPSHLSSLVRRIESLGADLVHAMEARIGPTGVLSCMGPPRKGRSYATFKASPSAWLHRRDIVHEIGFWPDHRRLSCSVDKYYFKMASQAGKRIEFNPDLTVLKFPAALFSIYSLRDTPPQLLDLDAIKDDAEGFKQRLLVELALVPFKETPPAPLTQGPVHHIVARVLSKTARFCFHQALKLYGQDRWPRYQYRVWRFQKHREKALIKKGLST